tara:strand:+ start:182 stop:442 length:261 start_codon:yes stop_codon:yes gene_type:complete
MNWIEIIGCVAGVLTSFAFFPQIIKLLKTKQSAGISISTFVCTFAGCSIWFVYGVFIDSFAIVLFNLINVITTITIIFLSRKYLSY